MSCRGDCQGRVACSKIRECVPEPVKLVAAPDALLGLPAPTASPVWKAKHSPALTGVAVAEMMSGSISPVPLDSFNEAL